MRLEWAVLEGKSELLRARRLVMELTRLEDAAMVSRGGHTRVIHLEVEVVVR